MFKYVAQNGATEPLFVESKGDTQPLGATLDNEGCNFAVYCLGSSVEICFFDEAENQLSSYFLQPSPSHVWHIYLKGVKAGQCYAYRVDGHYQPEYGVLFNRNNLLIDPYAKRLSKIQENFTQTQSDENDSLVAKSVVVDQVFDWQGGSKPNIAPSERILYELHPKGFTQNNPNIPSALRGKYLGLSHPESIKHYQDLGITSLQIMPIFSFVSELRLKDLGLTNYWGYNPINFFSPDVRYATQDPVNEFKTMVRELHNANIEVILDVVFNHTAEGGTGGVILSFKGFDNKHYYTFESDQKGVDYLRHSNYSGCGNTFNLDSPWALKMVIDSLRYWVEEMQVDGFRFDLAAALARESKSFNRYSAFFKVLMLDPVLSQVVLIAEPWDIGPGGYQLGAFPEQWNECNDRYRDTMRAFWKSDECMVPEVATRLLGSRDYFPLEHRNPMTSVNYICYHDGFTLHDLVSFSERHNQANGEYNRDGHGHNLSANYGCEGPTKDKNINRLRQQQKRNLITTLFLSQGTPHFLAGDEIGNSQSGNNNAYCQDNELSWIDWHLTDADEKLFTFTKNIIALRKSSSMFGQITFNDNAVTSDHVKWYHADGHLMQESDWHNCQTKTIGLQLIEGDAEGEHWFLILNSSTQNLTSHLPELAKDKVWHLVLDTCCESGALVEEKINASCLTQVKAHSILLFSAQVKLD